MDIPYNPRMETIVYNVVWPDKIEVFSNFQLARLRVLDAIVAGDGRPVIRAVRNRIDPITPEKPPGTRAFTTP